MTFTFSPILGKISEEDAPYKTAWHWTECVFTPSRVTAGRDYFIWLHTMCLQGSSSWGQTWFMFPRSFQSSGTLINSHKWPDRWPHTGKSLFCPFSVLEYHWKYFRIRFYKDFMPQSFHFILSLFLFLVMCPICSFIHPFTYSPIYALKKRWESHCGDSKINKGVSPVRTIVIQGRRQECAEMTTTQPGAPQEQISAMSQETVFCQHAQGRALASAVGAAEGTVTSTNSIREKGCVFFIQQDLIIPWSTELNICANLCLFLCRELRAKKGNRIKDALKFSG